MKAMTALSAHTTPSLTTSARTLAPGQLVEFDRPSPRGGRLACQGIVESVKFSSVVVHCTDSPVIGLTPGTLLRLSVGELRAL